MGATTKGKWEVYKGIGKLSTLKGAGTFTVKPSDKPGEFRSWIWKELRIITPFKDCPRSGFDEAVG